MDYRYGLSKPLYLLRSNYAIALMNSNLALNGNTVCFGASGRNKTNDLVDGFKTANMSTTYSSHDCIMNSALDFLVYLFVPGKVCQLENSSYCVHIRIHCITMQTCPPDQHS